MAEQRKPKRIVFCFDGTWNRLSVDCLTNVAMLAQMVRPVAHDGTPQIVYYDEGIGTSGNKVAHVIDGALGHGMLKIMREAYRFLIFNYESGDEIFAFGFSRGAYTARSFVGFIRHAGILDIARASQIDRAIDIYRAANAGTGTESPEGLRFRAENSLGVCVSAADRDYRKAHVPGFDPACAPLLEIKYLGVWDTVRALGVPDFLPFSGWFNRRYGFHDAVLSSKVKAARHAVALDELRPTFRATLFGRDKIDRYNARNVRAEGPPLPPWKAFYQEQWFPGVHGAVGGGGDRRGLSDGALDWVLTGARLAGLDLRDGTGNKAFDLRPDPLDALQNDSKVPWTHRGPLGWLRRLVQSPRKGPDRIDEVSLPALRRWHAAAAQLPEGKLYRPGALKALEPALAAGTLAEPVQIKSGGGEALPQLEDYTIVIGDSLSKLAKARLGDVKRWTDLFELNRDRIADPDFLPIGLVIRLPLAQASRIIPEA
ncbi:MAG: phospholipase effector Tle1 domain-containing protein [Novosphingobium sp.]